MGVTEIDIWAELPLYMSCKDVMSLGFKKTKVYEMFRDKTFPPIIQNYGIRVNKFKLKEWLEENETKENQ